MLFGKTANLFLGKHIEQCCFVTSTHELINEQELMVGGPGKTFVVLLNVECCYGYGLEGENLK